MTATIIDLKGKFQTHKLYLLICLLFLSGFPVFACTSSERGETISINDSGEGIQVWEASEGGFRVIQSSSYTFATGWSAPATISPPDQNNLAPSVTMSDAGDFVVLWVSVDPILSYNVLYAAVQLNGGSLSSPIVISDSTERVITSSYFVTIDNSGNVMADWISLLPTADPNVFNQAERYANTPIASIAWSAPQTVRIYN